MAVTDLGLSPQEFWGLTWYEWGMYVIRLHKENKKRSDEYEFLMGLFGDFMSLFANANRDTTKQPAPFKRSDFYKFSYDTQLTEDVDPELFQKIGRRLGGTIKKKDGDK